MSIPLMADKHASKLSSRRSGIPPNRAYLQANPPTLLEISILGLCDWDHELVSPKECFMIKMKESLREKSKH